MMGFQVSRKSRVLFALWIVSFTQRQQMKESCPRAFMAITCIVWRQICEQMTQSSERMSQRASILVALVEAMIITDLPQRHDFDSVTCAYQHFLTHAVVDFTSSYQSRVSTLHNAGSFSQIQISLGCLHDVLNNKIPPERFESPHQYQFTRFYQRDFLPQAQCLSMVEVHWEDFHNRRYFAVQRSRLPHQPSTFDHIDHQCYSLQTMLVR